MDVYQATVIITNLTKRGNGLHDDSPIRTVREVWTLDGEKIAEFDVCKPYPER